MIAFRPYAVPFFSTVFGSQSSVVHMPMPDNEVIEASDTNHFDENCDM